MIDQSAASPSDRASNGHVPTAPIDPGKPFEAPDLGRALDPARWFPLITLEATSSDDALFRLVEAGQALARDALDALGRLADRTGLSLELAWRNACAFALRDRDAWLGPLAICAASPRLSTCVALLERMQANGLTPGWAGLFVPAAPPWPADRLVKGLPPLARVSVLAGALLRGTSSITPLRLLAVAAQGDGVPRVPLARLLERTAALRPIGRRWHDIAQAEDQPPRVRAMLADRPALAAAIFTSPDRPDGPTFSAWRERWHRYRKLRYLLPTLILEVRRRRWKFAKPLAATLLDANLRPTDFVEWRAQARTALHDKDNTREWMGCRWHPMPDTVRRAFELLVARPNDHALLRLLATPAAAAADILVRKRLPLRRQDEQRLVNSIDGALLCRLALAGRTRCIRRLPDDLLDHAPELLRHAGTDSLVQDWLDRRRADEDRLSQHLIEGVTKRRDASLWSAIERLLARFAPPERLLQEALERDAHRWRQAWKVEWLGKPGHAMTLSAVFSQLNADARQRTLKRIARAMAADSALDPQALAENLPAVLTEAECAWLTDRARPAFAARVRQVRLALEAHPEAER